MRSSPRLITKVALTDLAGGVGASAKMHVAPRRPAHTAGQDALGTLTMEQGNGTMNEGNDDLGRVTPRTVKALETIASLTARIVVLETMMETIVKSADPSSAHWFQIMLRRLAAIFDGAQFREDPLVEEARELIRRLQGARGDPVEPARAKLTLIVDNAGPAGRTPLGR